MEKTYVEIEVFADIPSWWIPARDTDAGHLAAKAVADFTSLSNVVSLRLWNGSNHPIKIEAFDDASDFDRLAYILDKEASRIRLPRTFVRLSSDVSYTKADLEQAIQSDTSADTSSSFSIEEREEIFADAACSGLHSTLIDLYLALSIAHPGSLYFWECWLFSESRFLRREHGAMTSFDEVRKRAAELKWPEIRVLNVRDVYEWLVNVPGFTDRRGVGPVGRAVAALSYLVKMKAKDENALSLVWALLGLEALYGRGIVGLKSQLLEKSEVLLGPRQENKKVFGWMYDFRSRLLHGDMDLLYQHNNYDADPDYENIWNELYECEALASAVLLSTLQNLCQRGSYSLEFSYTLK